MDEFKSQTYRGAKVLISSDEVQLTSPDRLAATVARLARVSCASESSTCTTAGTLARPHRRGVAARRQHCSPRTREVKPLREGPT
jgi:hypothetical protein